MTIREQQHGVVSLTWETLGRVNFACAQNDIAILRRLSVSNGTDLPLDGLRVTMRASPPVIREKSWILDRVAPGSEHEVADTRVAFDIERIAGLNEAEIGELELRIAGEGIEPIIEHRQIDLLARDEWGGLGDMVQLLAAFVSPNERVVAKLLKDASTLLEKQGYDGSLDGYQTENPARAYMLAAAIWSAATQLGLSYAQPPVSFETEGQKIRGPARIADEGIATCLDLTLLLAAAFEAAGLNAVVLFSKGHAWVAVWIQKKDFGHVTEPDVVAVRKAVQAHELIPLETTLLTQRPSVGFVDAEDKARRRLAEHRDAEFIVAVDIARSRAARVLPQASPDVWTHEKQHPTGQVTPPRLPDPPDFGRLPGEEVDEEPQTPQGRIERWQRKLLDLSLRNRLLNFKLSNQTVPFLCPNVATLEDALAKDRIFRAVSLVDEDLIGDREVSVEERIRIEEKWASELLDKNQIAVPLSTNEMNKRLLTLFRRANSDVQEGGTNTLFLAAGFLRWRKTEGDTRDFRSPLLLIPVKLERRSAQSPFTIAHHDDDVRINLTLLEFLKRDFQIRVPKLEGDLPLDDSGIDVQRILEIMQEKVKDVAHVEVVEDLALSTFSFSKYLMWKDLADRADQLRENRLVKHLIDGPEQNFERQGGDAVHPGDVDQRRSPGSLFTPLPADSSQLASIIAAADGLDFYLVGPPGTGKSQTITNMISQCLAEKKTVLFVAEKAAALDVVHRRLVKAGLGDCVLELHSNKTDRKNVISQLGRGWDRMSQGGDTEWVQVTESLRVSRDQLNGYVQALHEAGSQGFSVFTAIGRVVKHRDVKFEVSFESKDAHDAESYGRLVSLAKDTARVHAIASQGPALSLIEKEDWSFQWQAAFLEKTKAYRASLEKLREAEGVLSKALGIRVDTVLSYGRRANIKSLVPRLLADAVDVSGVPDLPAKQLHVLAQELGRDVDSYFAAKSVTEASYPLKAIRRMPVDEIDVAWRDAQARLWPASFFACRKVRKLLQSYAEDGKANPAVDLAALISVHELDTAIQKNPVVAVAGADESWDINQAENAIEQAIVFREAIGNFRDEIEDSLKHTSAVGELVICEDGPVHVALKRYMDAEEVALTRQEDFARENGRVPSEVSVAEIEEGLSTIVTETARLEDWVMWTEIRNRAISNGLGPMVKAIENGLIEGPADELFESAYAAWWLPLAMDDCEVLRRFRYWEHEEVIRRFCDLDEKVAGLTSAEVMKRIRHDLPTMDGVPKNSGLGALRHQLNLRRPSMPIRHLLGELSDTLGKLAPCVLMSPLSVAQYLPAGKASFDVVIFDEASQITTWDAIGAIARGQQTIVVGDPKQLPPTNFFGRTDDEDEELPEIERDMPSILDEVSAAGLSKRQLNWHYRSRDEALITFSNRHYYDGSLVTFPAASADSNALQFHKVDGVYVRGPTGRVNLQEGEAIAQMVRQRLTSWLQIPEQDRHTLGVITFNSEQQSLILNQLDAMRRSNPELEWFFEEDREEPVIVKNLENIQGDERDVMLFSITFGPDDQGKLTMNFGPLNNDGGERRLNVAITRARRELHVYSTIVAEQIDLSRTHARGVRDLKAFLDYAERGPETLARYDEGSLGPAENPFESAVAEAFENRGWEVRTQIGMSGFRIDLAIVHPDKAGSYLCGIECDGAMYHSSASARDRDKIRQAVLEGLGWTIIRIWSTDWFKDADDVIERVHKELTQLLQEDRETGEEAVEPAKVVNVEETKDGALEIKETDGPRFELKAPSKERQLEFAQNPSNDHRTNPRLHRAAEPFAEVVSGVDDSSRSEGSHRSYELVLDASRFYESSYSVTVQRLMLEIVETEGPMPLNRLARRVAQEHGWQRTGKRILQVVCKNLGEIERYSDIDEDFVWAPGQHESRIPFRGLKNRPIRDVSRTEIASVIENSLSEITEAHDPVLVLARLLGIARLSDSARDYLQKCMTWREHEVLVGGDIDGEIDASMSAQDFKDELVRMFESASEVGEGTIVIQASDLHRAVGGYPGSDHRMPVCCEVMYAEMVDGVDEILLAPPRGQGASLKIEYLLPRPSSDDRSNFN